MDNKLKPSCRIVSNGCNYPVVESYEEVLHRLESSQVFTWEPMDKLVDSPDMSMSSGVLELTVIWPVDDVPTAVRVAFVIGHISQVIDLP